MKINEFFRKNKIDVRKFAIGYIVISVMLVALIFFKATQFTRGIEFVIFGLLLIPCAMIDYKLKIIPNKVLLVGIVLRILTYFIYFLSLNEDLVYFILEDIAGAIICGGVFLIASIIKKDSIGFGDVKLFFVMGIYLGLLTSFNVIFFCLVASFIFAVVMLVTRKINRKDSLPMAPFLLVGLFLTLIIGI